MKFKGVKHKTVLTEGEEQLFQTLISLRGYRDEFIFSAALRLLYRKEFPPSKYEKKKPDIDLSTEEQCIQRGGEVIMKDNVRQCRVVSGSLEVFEPLA